jgi:hypothetical protein
MNQLYIRNTLKRRLSPLNSEIGPFSKLNSLAFLNRSREHRSSKLADKIYGVYSILQTFGVALREPDYAIPVHTLCEEIAVSIILQQRSLIIFDFLRSHSRLPELPSWVPGMKNLFCRILCLDHTSNLSHPKQTQNAYSTPFRRL